MEVWTPTNWYGMVKNKFEIKLGNRNNQIFHLALDEINSQISESREFTLTENREYISSLGNDPKPFILYNSNVKKILQEHYGDEIKFTLNPQEKKLEFVFLISVVWCWRLWCKCFEVSCWIINTSYEILNLWLDNTFCDTENLKRSRKDAFIPNEWMTFYSTILTPES